VSTNLFGKGGGEVMSADFGVKFLGGVPIDTQWGVLVEEGKRLTYGGVAKAEDVENGSENGDKEGMAAEGEKEPGLLVDKYRNCSLSGLFEGITKEVVQIVGEGHAGI